MPCTLRWPRLYTGEPPVGLSAGTPPSGPAPIRLGGNLVGSAVPGYPSFNTEAYDRIEDNPSNIELVKAILTARPQVVLLVATIGPRLLPYRTFTVLSGSMEPGIPTGSMIFAHEVDASQLARTAREITG